MQLRDHPSLTRSGNRFRVDPRILKVEPGLNLRDLDSAEERPALDDLKAFIRENGVPGDLEIRLKGEDLYITDGHRRHKAALEVIAEGGEIESVTVIEEPRTTNDADRIARIMNHGAGKPLTQLQKAEGVKRLLGFGWTRQQIAKRNGWTEQTVANFEEMLALPEAVKDQVREGAISATAARQVVRHEGPERAAQTISEAREVARREGRSKVTPKRLASPNQSSSKPGLPAFIHRDMANSLIATLREIAVRGDGRRDRHSARNTLKLSGQDCPPEEPGLAAQGQEQRELVYALREMVETYREDGTPDEEQPQVIRAAMLVLSRYEERDHG